MTAGVFCCSARYRLHRSVAAVPKLHVRKQWSHLSVARYLSVFTTHMPRSARGKNKRACGPTIQTYINTHTYIYIYASIHPSIHPSIHSYMHPYIHTYIHTYMHTTQLVHTQLTRTYSSTHNLLHANPSPSLFPFLLSTCHLYLSCAACWKKLTCGVIRSFNFQVFKGGAIRAGIFRPSSYLRPLALAATCGHLRPLEWLQVAASGCKWLQVAAFLSFTFCGFCNLNGNYRLLKNNSGSYLNFISAGPGRRKGERARE